MKHRASNNINPEYLRIWLHHS